MRAFAERWSPGTLKKETDMATPATKYVTREEFEPVKHAVERLSIRVEVLTNDVHQLTNRVADLAEKVDARFDQVDARLEQVEVAITELKKSVRDGNAAIVSVLNQLMARSR